MKDTSTKEFEAWHIAKYGTLVGVGVDIRWEIWKASRDAIVIEMPVIIANTDCIESEVDKMFLNGIVNAQNMVLDQCCEVLQDAGIKVFRGDDDDTSRTS